MCAHGEELVAKEKEADFVFVPARTSMWMVPSWKCMTGQCLLRGKAGPHNLSSVPSLFCPIPWHFCEHSQQEPQARAVSELLLHHHFLRGQPPTCTIFQDVTF